MTAPEVLGRAVALDEYALTVEELAIVAAALTCRPRWSDDTTALAVRLWTDLITIDTERAREAWTSARDSNRMELSWLVAIASELSQHTPKKENESL